MAKIIVTIQEKCKNICHLDSIEILQALHALIIQYRDRNKIGKNEFPKKAGLKRTALIPIESKKTTAKGKISTLDLLSVVKILNTYPELMGEFVEYLNKVTQVKGTHVQPLGESPVTVKDIEIKVKELIKDQLDIKQRLGRLEKKKTGVTG